jgi:putative transposase
MAGDLYGLRACFWTAVRLGWFKSFPVQSDEHFLTVCRYVERNALQADLVERAEDWRWSSLWWRHCGVPEACEIRSHWHGGIPRNWLQTVNRS